MRLIMTISQFSQAPFYSKIPLLSRLYAEGNQDELVRLARRGMGISHWAYVLSFVGLGVFGAPVLRHIGSNASFPSQLLWSLMGFAFFLERYGAMHVQLYTTTNHIIWHIANGVSGVLYIVIGAGLFGSIGVLAFPVGFLCGNLGFYSWYTASHAYKAFNIEFPSFEYGSALGPFLVLVAYGALQWRG
jgi:O-antigen/teichoic acid export membrane protein